MATTGGYTAPAPRVERQTVVTDANGNAVFNWPAGAFAAPPVVTIGVQGGTAFRSHAITANTAASTTVNVLVAAGVTLLGIGVLAVGAPAAGITVHAHAVAP
ncbi:hypothetical protein [Streptomyces griseofuscus]|uniref:Uncharacterized protein n=1 Tax=Streptomyces griseofuscus TaxID=146922 RepID=A0A7H1Q3R9_9ACTN|nr:hypothetical protein [Streptomyces griseofuscus]QNT94949.1 hypothetical protein HEP81_04677 [Streptomyces griseofuscus]